MIGRPGLAGLNLVSPGVADFSLEGFHRGDRSALEWVYQSHFQAVWRAVGRVLSGPEQENVCHDVFVRLIQDERRRRQFTGGSLEAWLRRSAYALAIDAARRQRGRTTQELLDTEPSSESLEAQLEASEWVAQFRARLPPKWHGVFNECFVQGLDQRAAAARLDMRRTTLAYQWARVALLIKAFAKENP